MTTIFYIPENRIEELKDFIKSDLPSARFNHNPYKVGKDYRISINLEVEEGNKLSILRNNWYNQDHPIVKANKNWLNRLLSNFYCG